ncbi:FG-GAP repeat domain-containing protein [Streptomyces buecherae]|uniref:FG-GAP repeat domain-containing protein n=1 Tax=Streptomyces buecherae TaxID=2763006 RepID=UPI001C27D601|nr:VCBS repeat-containing protein [Streptomyces buecherae]
MTYRFGHRAGQALTGLATVLTATALTGTTASAATHDPAPVAAAVQEATSSVAAAPDAKQGTRAARSAAPLLPVTGVTRSGVLYWYWPDGRGGLGPRERFEESWAGVNAASQVDMHSNGASAGLFARIVDGTLVYSDSTGVERDLGRGWDKYNALFSPGNLGGTARSDLLTRDGGGTLWLHPAKSDGTLSARKKVGPGWNQYTQLAGQHDLTGDGRPDIVARDRSGGLWLYKGTGDLAKPFATRSAIGPGWNAYNHLVSTGDVNGDGRTDLLARDTAGALWLYKGTGKASAPYQKKTKIGNAGWNQYAQIF